MVMTFQRTVEKVEKVEETFPSSWKVNSHVKPAILKFYHIEIPNANTERCDECEWL